MQDNYQRSSSDNTVELAPLTQGKTWTPSHYFLDQGDNIWKGIVVVQRWQTTSGDLFNFGLCVFLDFRI
jgi:hypothetical protein